MDAVISIMQVFLPPKAHLGAMVIDHSWVVKSIHNLIRALLEIKHAALIQLLLDKGE